MAREILTSPAIAAGDYAVKRLVRERLLARRHRVRTLRWRVAAVLLAAFVALWMGIYVQLATGHDPALVANAARKATAATTVSTRKSASTTGTTATAAVKATTTATTTASTASSAGSSTAVTTKAS
ncbi:MAG: hypothetical protein M3071_00755 [Actinomycetota bacterium]|nr:hypothetical protein [Actinomycetota bacterium]